MSRFALFGPGYVGARLAEAVGARGWTVARIGRAEIDDAGSALATATHILSTVPPDEHGDPVLRRYRPALARAPRWIGYLSSTGVYGDTGGAWVDESAPVGHGRRSARAVADREWLSLGAHVFRLPGIYGPGRSQLDRIVSGAAYRVELPGQVFSRIHVDDIVAAVIAGFGAPPGAYNIADDCPAPQDEVTAYAARLLGAPMPPVVPPENLPPTARAFYAENRRIANGRAKRLLGWQPVYPSYREGLRALSATISPASVSAPPSAAVTDQR
ncbi:SDR family NAD(P)-dependent oxidoreductase [Sphingomonas sp.]|uniref:SDR family NAD(P)-dependent oxidoreductase n=1 Tax=Sphingomonas sp. TaxID=28214 RepID=UPI002DB63DDB|nr:SDR family NAD(P)-dependent oxidoreductase [Sphingomonas sp.]HEU4969704.1 SDR family NAD(P)-dependent oxidoreductase [Sphingomonas sp.]